jgi:hypothetical protein
VSTFFIREARATEVGLSPDDHGRAERNADDAGRERALRGTDERPPLV